MPPKKTTNEVKSFLDSDGEDEMVISNVAKDKKKLKPGSFQGMGLSEQVLNGIKRMGFNAPTPIQRQSIPVLLEGHDVVAMARTGSGKTAAFAIPLINKLLTSKQSGATLDGVRAIVLSPTRELAQQTHKVILSLSKGCNLRTIMLIGGQALTTQFELLANIPDIIVATPGRLVHHLLEVQFSLQNVQFCCFDEADRLFEMGFAQQLYEIIRRMGENRQTALFSATMPQALIEFSRAGLKNPISIRLENEGKLSPDLQLSFLALKTNEKNAALIYLLKNIIPKKQQAIVFVATRHHVDLLVELLNLDGITSLGIYGVMDAQSRTQNIEQFKSKQTRILVVTDLAARGIDIPLLDNVVHYDFPTQPKLFIHRSGRVARAGQKGIAFTFISPEDYSYFIDLCLFFGWKLPFNIKKKTTAENEQAAAEQKATPTIGPDGKVIDDGDDDDSRLTSSTGSSAPDFEFGSIPNSLLDFEMEHCDKLINMNDLERLIIGCNNAYEKYNKSKGVASTASVKRWKEIRENNLKDAVPIHPWFTRQLQSDDKKEHNPNSFKAVLTAEEAKRQLLQYNPNQTIFELMNRDMDMVKAKRQQHDVVIANAHGLEEVVGDRLARKYKELLPQEDPLAASQQVRPHMTKVVVKEEKEKVIITAADRRKRKTIDDNYKAGKITEKEYLSLLKTLPVALQNPIKLDNDTKKKLDEQKQTQVVVAEEKKLSLKDQLSSRNVMLTRASLPPSLLPPTNPTPLFNTGPVKRPLAQSVPAAVVAATTTAAASQQTPKATTLQSATLKALLNAASTEMNIDDSAQHVAKRKKRGQMSAEELKDQHFISLTRGNEYEQQGLAIQRLDDMALELTAEDADGLRAQRKTRKWNDRTKKFVTVFEGKDAFGKNLINESGQKVNKDYVPGELYAQWRSKNRKLDGSAFEDDGPSSSSSGPADATTSKRFNPNKAKRNGFGGDDDSGSSNNNKGGRKVSLGLKSADQILNNRKEEAKNKFTAKKGKDAAKKRQGGRK